METAVCDSGTRVLNSQGRLYGLVQWSNMRNAQCAGRKESHLTNRKQKDREEMITFIPGAKLHILCSHFHLPMYCGDAPDGTKRNNCLACALTKHFNQPYRAQCTCCRHVTLKNCLVLAKRGNIMSFPAVTPSNPWETFPLKHLH